MISTMLSCGSRKRPVLALLLVILLMQVGETMEQSNMTCEPGFVLPVWTPIETGLGDTIARAIVYFAALCFMFLGVSIIADRFMSAIEVITSKEKTVTVKRPNGEVLTVSVRVWNETVSNLTLMALGSSAPEILLSIIEICANNFQAGNLGPSTIVGSAAFNLFVIIALCISVIPNGEVRRIKHLRVFMVTALVSLLAYIWMYLILEEITPGVIDLWEALVTLFMFPLTVIWAYIADRRIFVYRFLRKKYTAEKVLRRDSSLNAGAVELGIPGETNANHFELNHDHDNVDFKGKKFLDTVDTDAKELEETRKETVRLLRELRAKHPDADLQTLEQMANYEALNQQQKSRAFYRIQATRRLCGAGNILKKTLEKNRASIAEVKIEVPQEDTFAHIFFEPAQYTVMENVGSFNITVTRHGGDMSSTIYVDYRTEDATANAGSDYHYAEGTLIFKPGETQKDISLTIIDDDIFEEDEHFIVRLSNVRMGGPDGMFQSSQEDEPQAKLVEPYVAQITILDDDHAGIFQFEEKEVRASESVGMAQLKVVRSAGARGTVRIPYRTIEGTAKGNGMDFIDVEGEVEFENDETWKFIEVSIVDDEEYEKEENFYVELGQPKLIKRGNGSDNESYTSEHDEMYNLMSEEDRRIANLGKPQLGEISHLNVKIMESTEFKNTVDKLIKKTNVSLVVGTSSWREQFVEALTVSAGDDEESGEEKLPSCGDYVMHFLTIFWKLLFAFVPPTDLLGGWACFFFSIVMIGVLTMFIGDLAEQFGCTVGLKDSITAISFVALGTSVPDTFASKVAAVGDKYADASIGNVTGSNAVNVFLGIGVAWTIAAIANYKEGFKVDPGALAFSVLLYTVLAVIAIAVLMIRRNTKSIRGELGGPMRSKVATSMFFLALWLTYLVLCSLVANGNISWKSVGT